MLRVEILCTGDEILTGKTVNTNYSHIARRLVETGFSVGRGTTVGDDRDSLRAAFREAAERADAVIVNGGLGPTVDDLSQETAADAAGVALELHRPWLARIQEFYTSRGREMPANNRKQALLPAGAEFIDNPIGTACGFALDIAGARFFFTPGVPRELKKMLDEQIIPRLQGLRGDSVVTRLKRFHSFGIGESRADQMLAGVEALAPGVKLGFQSHYPQLETKLAVQAGNDAATETLLAPVAAAVRERLGNFIVAEDEQTLEGRIVAALDDARGSLATLESFTDGGVAARLLRAADGAASVRRGVVAADPGELYAAVGLDRAAAGDGPGCDAALRLAAALRTETGASHALAVLGRLAADRTGAEVFIAVAGGAQPVCRQALLPGRPGWVRLGAVELALDCLRRYLSALPVHERIDFEQH